MCKLQSNSKARQLTLVIPSKLLTEQSLSNNDKLVLGVDLALKDKLGYNSYKNDYLSKLFSLHVNSISKSRRALVQQEFLKKTGREYQLTEKSVKLLECSNQSVHLPYDVYNLKIIKSGEKLLWGLYNSVSRGFKDYFAKRETTARQLAISVETVTKYTKSLNHAGLLKLYKHNFGYCSSQTVIVTCDIINGEFITELNRAKDHQGNWERSVDFPILK